MIIAFDLSREMHSFPNYQLFIHTEQTLNCLFTELMITGTGTNEPEVQTRPTSSTKAKSSDKALKDPNVKRPKPESGNEDSSTASSSRHRKKKFKKYFCFLPF